MKNEYLRSFTKNNRCNLLFSIVFTVLNTPLGIIGSWLLGQIIDVITDGSHAALRTTGVYCVYFICSLVVIDLFMYFFKSRFIKQAMISYKSLAYANISAKDIAVIKKETPGSYISLLTNDTNLIEELYLKNGFLLLHMILVFFETLAMMLFYSIPLALISVGLSLLPMLAGSLMGKGMQTREKQVSDSAEGFLNQFKELLNGFSTIKLFHAESKSAELFDVKNEQVEESRRSRYFWECLMSTVCQGLCGNVMQFGIFIIGAVFALHGNISAGTVLMFFNLSNYIIQPVSVVPQFLAGRKAALTLIEKLSSMTEKEEGQEGKKPLTGPVQEISLHDVSFSYPESEESTIKDISLDLEKGKKYAIVGPSGSGKSTLLNLIAGIYDDYAGSIQLNSYEIRDLSSEDVYRRVNLLDQHVFIFATSVQNNITMFASCDSDRIGKAISAAGLDTFVENNGMDYSCGEDGKNLSGGERQRLAIARCLLHGADVLLFDEATTGLDNENAHAVMNTILSMKETTGVLVTHQLNAAELTRFDEILVLKDGQICERGTFDELMEKQQYFFGFYNISK